MQKVNLITSKLFGTLGPFCYFFTESLGKCPIKQIFYPKIRGDTK